MLLSICLPTYNRREQAERQLNFLLEDASLFLGVDVEILVSNNASPDGTDDVIKDIRVKNDKFQYFLQEENIGAIANIAFLAKKACGKYIWITGDDDILRPGTVERVVKILKEYSDIDLGAVFLSDYLEVLEKCRKNTRKSSDVQWQDLSFVDTTRFRKWDNSDAKWVGLQTFDYNNTQYYDLNGPYGDFVFITRCIVLRESYLSVVSSPYYMNIYCFPFACSYLSIRGRCFFVDPCISIYQSICDATWIDKQKSVLTIDLANSILNLKYLGVPDLEIRPIFSSFVRYSKDWLLIMHPYYGFDMKLTFKYISLVVKNGCFKQFVTVLIAGIARHIRTRLGRIKTRLIGNHE